MAEDAAGQYRTVGNALILFSLVGLTLGAVMTGLGLVGEGFLDGPSALGIGAMTGLVGLGMRVVAHFTARA